MTNLPTASLLVGLLVAAAPLSDAQQASAPPERPRTAIFISDLHLGVGRDPAGTSASPRWRSFEDFRWHAELRDFLTRVDEIGEHRVDLVILGDFLELWQSLSKTDCHHEKLSKDLGCTEAEAITRTARIIDQHGPVFDHLRWFAEQGQNRITIVPGNHDAALMFSGVRKLVLDRIQAPPDSVRVAVEGYWWSQDGKLIAEHGHQIGADVNRFDGWPDHPFIEKAGTKYLQQPWGEQMVQEVFNEYEATYPILDNLSEELRGIRLAWKLTDLSGKLAVSANLTRFMLFQMSWAQLQQGLGGSHGEEFDVPAIREQYKEKPERFILDSLSPADPLRAALEAELHQGRAIPLLGDLADDEILSLCAQRQLHNATLPPEARLSECPKSTGLGAGAGAAREKLVRGAKDRTFREYLTALRDGLPVGGRPTRSFTHYVFAHTHREEGEHSPFRSIDPWRPAVWNDGAWQRRVDPEQLCTLARKRNQTEEAALAALIPEDLPACYSFVRARWPQEKAEPKLGLLFWVQETGQPGSIQASCPFEVHSDCRGR